MKRKSKLLHLFGLAISPLFCQGFWLEVTLGFPHTHTHDDHGQSSSSGLFQKSLRSALLSFHTPKDDRLLIEKRPRYPPIHWPKEGGWGCFRLCTPFHQFFLQLSRKMGVSSISRMYFLSSFRLGSCFPFGSQR